MGTVSAKIQLDLLKEGYEREEQKILDLLSDEDRLELGHPIRDIHLLTTFNTKNHKYTVHPSLAIARFEEFEDVQIDVGYGTDFATLYGNLANAYAHLNNSKPADGAIVIYNTMNGIKDKLEERVNPVLKMCTLFISREGEDLTKYDEALNAEKIEDWKEAGIGMDSFFTLAFSSVKGFVPILNKISGDISEEMKRVKASHGNS